VGIFNLRILNTSNLNLTKISNLNTQLLQKDISENNTPEDIHNVLHVLFVDSLFDLQAFVQD